MAERNDGTRVRARERERERESKESVLSARLDNDEDEEEKEDKCIYPTPPLEQKLTHGQHFRMKFNRFEFSFSFFYIDRLPVTKANLSC